MSIYNIKRLKDLGNLTNVINAYKTGSSELVKVFNSLDLKTQQYIITSEKLSKTQLEAIKGCVSWVDCQDGTRKTTNGLTEAKVDNAIATASISTAEKGATISTLGLGNAFKGLWATLMANPLILVGAGVTALVTIFSKVKQAEEEASQKASEAASTYKEQSTSIDEAVTKYQELHQQLLAAKGNEEETANIKSQLLDLQKQLNEQFGEEYGKLNLVTDAYKDQTEAIKTYNKEAANTFLNKNRKGLNEAEDEMTSDNVYMLGNLNGLVNADELGTLNKIKKIASDNKIEFTDMGGFQFTGNAEEATTAINNFMNSVTKLREETGKTSDVLNNIFDGLLDNSGEALSDANSIIDEYGEKYQQKQLAEIASSDKLSSKYKEVTDAVNAYNDAVANSDNPYEDESVKSAYDNLQKIKGEISNNSDWDNYKDIINETFDEADDGSYTFYEDLKKNKNGIGDLANELNGLSKIDIQSMIEDGTDGANYDTFDKLSEKAEKYSVSVEDLITMLEKLGIVQGELSNQAASDETSLPSTEELQQQISDLNSAIDSIQSAYDTLNSAVEEYNSNGGTLSIDTIQSLLSLSDEYLACLQVENGQLSLNADAMAQLAQAKLDDAQATAVTQAMTELQAIANGEAAQSTTNYISGNVALMSSLAQLSGSYDGVAQAAMTAAQAQELSAQISAAAGKDKTATENVMKGLDTKLKLIQSTQNKIKSGGFGSVAKKVGSSKGSGGSSGKSEADKAKEYLDAYMKYMEASLDAGKITYQQYVDQVSKMLDDMYHQGKISTKDYFNYVKERLSQQLDIYKSALSAITSLLDDTMDKIQDDIDSLNDKNDALNQQKDDYDSILSVVDDVYQKEIDKLNEQKDLLQDKIDALNDQNDALDLQYRKEQALYALRKAQEQRTKKVN